MAWLCLASPAWAEPVTVPSGMAVTFHEVITDVPGTGLTYRFRFLAPAIGGGSDFQTIERDMLHLCEAFALPRLSKIGPVPRQLIISLSDRAVPFGQITPDATQFFETYRPENDRCIWEVF